MKIVFGKPAPRSSSNDRFLHRAANYVLWLFIFFNAICALNADDLVTENNLIISGDRLKITVYQNPDLSFNQKVTPQGLIDYPLLGPLMAKGKSTDQLKNEITELLSHDYLINPRVSIIIESYAPREVFVLGQVKKPQVYKIQPGKSLTLIQLIALSGGFTEEADRTKIKIIRRLGDKKKVLTINLKNLDSLEDFNLKTTDINLRPEDIIIIPSSKKQIAIMGNVNKPGIYFWSSSEQLRLTQALSLAGDLTSKADPGQILIIRKNNDPKDSTLNFIKVSLAEMLTNENPENFDDFVIEPNDTIIALQPSNTDKIYILGAVNQPGAYPIPRGIQKMTLTQALSQARGFNKFAATTKVKILRKDKDNKEKTFTVNVKKIIKGDLSSDVELMPGDIIYVPESFF